MIFLILMLFWLSETNQIWSFQAFWSGSVDFPHHNDLLAEIGHIWGIWALSWECVGVNVEGGLGGGGGAQRHISNAWHRVLSSCIFISFYQKQNKFKKKIQWYLYIFMQCSLLILNSYCLATMKKTHFPHWNDGTLTIAALVASLSSTWWSGITIYVFYDDLGE